MTDQLLLDNCRLAFALTPGGTGLSPQLNLVQPTIAAKVDGQFLLSVKSNGLDTVFVRVVASESGRSSMLLIVLATQGHELRLLADLSDESVSACIGEAGGFGVVRLVVFDDPQDCVVMPVELMVSEYQAVLEGMRARASVSTSDARFVELSMGAWLLSDINRMPYLAPNSVPDTVRACAVVTEDNRERYEALKERWQLKS